MSPPLYADRNVPRPLIEALRVQGLIVYEALLVTPDQTPDVDEIREAAWRAAILLSLNYAEVRSWICWAEQVASEDVGPVQVILLPAAPAGPRLLVRVRTAVHYLERLPVEQRPTVLLWHRLRSEIERTRQFDGFSADEVAIAMGWKALQRRDD